MEIKIKSYKISPSGKRGNVLTMPKVWVDDMALVSGDLIDIYRDENDRLILVANKQEVKEKGL